MLRVEQIEDFQTLRERAIWIEHENEYFRRRVRELADEIATLKGYVPAEQLQLELMRKDEQLAKLRQRVFGESSERRPSPHPPGPEPKKGEPQRGHGPTPQPRLPTREEHHRLPEEQRVCPACQGTLEEMGEVTEDAEEITVEKRRVVRVKHKRHKYRCRCNGAVKTAPAPLKLIPGGRYSLDFAVALGLGKWLDHLPLDRQRRMLERDGLVISTQTMWDQEDALAALLEPSYLLVLQYILGADVIGADETHWRLMKPGETKKWWAWCLTTDDAAWYMIEPSRSAETAAKVLGDFEGTIMCDGYAVYDTLARRSDARLRLAHCFAHARRKFYELHDSYPEQCRQALDMIDTLFLIERELPSPFGLEGDTLTAALELRTARRERESRPIAEALHQWALQQTALPRSALADALEYMLGRWKGLCAFLDDPMIPISNNQTERALRGMVIGRKNHYGSRSLRGTQVAAIFYTLIETCKLCDVDPEEYVRFVARAALETPGIAVLPQAYARGLRPTGAPAASSAPMPAA